MAKLKVLSAAEHSHLRLVPKRVLDVVRTQHLINIRVNEVGMAASCFPTFISRPDQSGNWVLSAVTGLELGKNLYVGDQQWEAFYQPSSMQTYPFHLMKSPKDDKKFTIGFDKNADAFSEQEGEHLFSGDKKASLYLSRITALLEANIKNDIQSFEFTQRLSELGLIKEISIIVEYEGGAVKNLSGLHTIDEDKLQALSNSDFASLRSKGYLAPIYALMFSVFQLNALMQKHNLRAEGVAMTQIKLEVATKVSH